MKTITLDCVREMFELWMTRDMPNAPLELDSDGNYDDDTVNGVFVGFQAGMVLGGIDIDLGEG